MKTCAISVETMLISVGKRTLELVMVMMMTISAMFCSMMKTYLAIKLTGKHLNRTDLKCCSMNSKAVLMEPSRLTIVSASRLCKMTKRELSIQIVLWYL